MNSIYEHPFELHLVVQVDPKAGFDIVQVRDHVFLTRGPDWVHYDPRDVMRRLNNVLRELAQQDDGVAWAVKSVSFKEDEE